MLMMWMYWISRQLWIFLSGLNKNRTDNELKCNRKERKSDLSGSYSLESENEYSQKSECRWWLFGKPQRAPIRWAKQAYRKVQIQIVSALCSFCFIPWLIGTGFLFPALWWMKVSVLLFLPAWNWRHNQQLILYHPLFGWSLKGQQFRWYWPK